MLPTDILLTGLFVFFARIRDVAIGTIRTIVTVQGRSYIAFILAIFEITIWVLVASTVLTQVREIPILVLFYAFGYATGNVIGIKVERKIAFGMIILKVITRDTSNLMPATIREMGQPVTVFTGQGQRGPVHELYIACRRRDLGKLLGAVKKIDPNAFYVIEQARDISKVYRPLYTPLGGWRASSMRK